MAAERVTRRNTGKPGRRRDDTGKPAPGRTQAVPQSRHVDFDPWAMLAELMVTPEEEPTEHTGPKKK